jgi:hypothetical protein
MSQREINTQNKNHKSNLSFLRGAKIQVKFSISKTGASKTVENLTQS